MLRLTVILCASMFVTLLLAGEDRGQLRPGLAQAVAQGQEIVVLERRRAAPVEPAPAESAPKTILEAAAEDSPVVSAAYAPPPPAPAAPASASEPVAAAEPAPAPAPIFTLSALPSLGGDRVVADAPLPAAEAPAPAADGAEVWYVTASSVNVREAPSTEAGVVDRLSSGEAVTVVGQPDGEWVQIVIEGDGIQGYVAARFLSPDAP
jgi:hypothetical protein